MTKKALTVWGFGVIFYFCSISSTQAMRFAVISDVRAYALDYALTYIETRDIDFIIIPGDFYYDKQDYYSHFVKFGFEVKPGLKPDRQNLYFALGNHDAPPFGDPTFRTLIAPYYPENGPVFAPKGTIYSFDRGNCHFVVTNQYWDYPGGGYTTEQLNWIKKDLAASDQAFKFVIGHEPAFPLEKHVGDSLDADPAQRDAFWNILVENDVQAYFCGHTHNLSHIVHQGVYQIDNGEVRNSPLCATIVDVADNVATIKSYKTVSVLLERRMNSIQYEDPVSLMDPVVETDIDLDAEPEKFDRLDVLYSAARKEDFLDSYCFIGTLSRSLFSE